MIKKTTTPKLINKSTVKSTRTIKPIIPTKPVKLVKKAPIKKTEKEIKEKKIIKEKKKLYNKDSVKSDLQMAKILRDHQALIKTEKKSDLQSNKKPIPKVKEKNNIKKELDKKNKNLVSLLKEKKYTADVIFVKTFLTLAENENIIMDKKLISRLTKLSKALLNYKKDDIVRELYLNLNTTLQKMSTIFNVKINELFHDLYSVINNTENMLKELYTPMENLKDLKEITTASLEAKKIDSTVIDIRRFLREYYFVVIRDLIKPTQ